MFFNRNETITFSKLKTGVQEMIRRNFTERHLGQIQKVMPNFYKFTYEKSKKFIQSNSSKYELVIIPVLMVKGKNKYNIININSLMSFSTRFYNSLSNKSLSSTSVWCDFNH